MLIDHEKGIVDVFRAFNQEAKHPFPYPTDNITPFEEWYYQSYVPEDARGRIYLPIFWTGYYVRANYGKNKEAISHLQGYLNILDTTKKYYTIVQYDDGILNDLRHLDIRVYSMSGQPMDYPLPLVCTPHKYTFQEQRDIFVSFVGRPTHTIREKILTQLVNYPESYITSQHHSLKEYCRILAQSTFVLCPRGYGPSSFRIMEALQFGAIPVYISNKLIYGHNHHFPGLSIMAGPNHFNVDDMMAQLQIVATRCEEIVRAIPETFEKYYTYVGTKRLILQNLNYGTNPKDTDYSD